MNGQRSETRPPGPRGYPVVGNTLALSDDLLAFFERLRDDYGRVASYRTVGTDACMIAEPDAIGEILVESQDSFEKGKVLTRNLADAMGEGLFVTDGDQWRDQRTHVQPAFYSRRLDTYVPQMRATARETVERWEDGGVVDVETAMTETTADVLGRTLFGVDVADYPVVSAASEAILARFDTTRFWSFLPDWLPTPVERRYRQRLDELRRFVDELARRRREQSPGDRGDDLLSILVSIAEAGKITRDEFRDNVITFLFAGHETTALGLTYTLLCLARNPGEQATLRTEIDDVCGETVTADDLDDLDRLGAVIDEALRLYPPVYAFFREPTRNVTLDGYEIPRGTTLVLPQWAVHRDPAWWDDPDAFRPDRFREGADRPRFSYFPFGGGQRHCIGMRFARMEMKVVLATILRRYRFDLRSDPDPELVPSTNLRPGDTIEIELHECRSDPRK